jgi:hypothetical protein
MHDGTVLNTFIDLSTTGMSPKDCKAIMPPPRGEGSVCHPSFVHPRSSGARPRSKKPTNTITAYSFR